MSVAPGRAPAAATDDVDAGLRAFVGRHPAALVLALAVDPAPRAVPVPVSLRLGPHGTMILERGLPEEVVPEDRPVVARLWAEVSRRGVAVGPIRRSQDPEVPGNLYLFDVRARHGVVVAVVTPGEAGRPDPVALTARAPESRTPRTGRMSKTMAAVITSVDVPVCRMLGWTEVELVGRRSVDLVHPDDQDRGVEQWLEMLETPGPGRPVRLRHLHKDGFWLWVEVTNCNRLADPAHGDVLTDMVDVSGEMAAVEALRARESLLGLLTDTVPIGLFHADTDGCVQFSNPTLRELTGMTVGSGLKDLLRVVVPEDRAVVEAGLEAVSAGNEMDVEAGLFPSYPERYCRIRVRPLLGDTSRVTGLTGCVTDITALVRTRKELEVQAASDPLTGCLNRAALMAVLQDQLDRSPEEIRGKRRGTAVIFVDLDGFKPVNDTLGHAAGDEVLVRIVERLRACVRAGDVVGRLGGDEFVVVCPGVPSAEDAGELARSVVEAALDRPVEIGESVVAIRASFGVGWSSAAGTRAEELIRQADAAMYRAKRAGHAGPVLARTSR